MPQFNDSVHIGDNQAAIAVGAAIGDPRIVVPTNEGVYAVVPKDYEIQNLEGYLPKPLRIRQHVTFHDTNSFIEYLKAYATQTATRLFFATEGEAFEAVIDYHVTGDTPGWCAHIASFGCTRVRRFSGTRSSVRTASCRTPSRRSGRRSPPTPAIRCSQECPGSRTLRVVAGSPGAQARGGSPWIQTHPPRLSGSSA
jgi:hypothetical protein